MRPFKKCLIVPIYEVGLWLIVSRDIVKSRLAMTDTFGELKVSGFDALCSYDNNTFGLFFTLESAKNIATVAHEVFHLTHRILELCCANFDENHHETAAYLNGYLMKLVWKELNK